MSRARRKCPTNSKHPDTGVPCTHHGFTDNLRTPQIAHGHVSEGHEVWWSKGYRGSRVGKKLWAAHQDVRDRRGDDHDDPEGGPLSTRKVAETSGS